MDIAVVATTFAIIFLAELPDKSMLAAITMSTRFKPGVVWVGLAFAFLVHGIIAVTAGEVIALLPKQLVLGAVGVLFGALGFYLLFGNSSEDSETPEDEETKKAASLSAKASYLKVAGTAFLVIFLAEWGDLTQITTASLAARYDSPLSVGIGSVGAEWLVAAIGVTVGGKLSKKVSITRVRKGAGLILCALGLWSIFDLIRMTTG